MLAQLMKPEYLAALRQTVDGDRGESISPEQYQAVVDAVSDENGRQVVSFVLSKVGYPYSQAYRDSGSYYDCSSLAYYAWQSAGVNLMYEGANTAAAEGKFCYDNNYLVDYEDMQAGDLIFYSYEENGRFYDITHVAIYMEYIDLNSLESRQDVAEVMLELGGTLSNEEAWSEIYNWANKTVSARFCSSTLQLGQFLQGYFI